MRLRLQGGNLSAAAFCSFVCTLVCSAALLFCVPLALTMADDFPQPTNSEKQNLDKILSAEEAAKTMDLPDGFTATVFAAEPDVQNPIAMSWDNQGRLWIAENYTYADRTQRLDLSLRDRVLVFTDKDGDGKFDERKVFTDDVQVLTSVAVGNGGVWLMCPPRVLFIPDADHDGVPDGPAQVVLDGFEVAQANYHNFANGLKFGPDGWLYGRCGHSCPGKIGLPGAPDAERAKLLGGMWRYHPRRKTVEVLNYGTTNPWGHDWNEYGERFLVNTVTGHLWHAFTGGRFTRSTSVDPNRYVYEVIPQHADHYHYDTGKGWTASRDGKANDLGGGHAHSGCMVYLGNNWPEEYRGDLFTLNFHGRRANRERLTPEGSGYVAEHEPDFFLSADPWFRGIDLDYGPDGSVFVLDWSDTGECHEHTGVHRTSGRIFKITYGEPKPLTSGMVDLTTLTDVDMVKLHTHPNAWFARRARLELTERKFSNIAEKNAVDRKSMAMAEAELRKLAESDNVIHALRAIWTLYALDAMSDAELLGLLDHEDAHVRAWGIRLRTDNWPLDDVDGPVAHLQKQITSEQQAEVEALLPKLVSLAENDKSAFVRLALAESLRRLPLTDRIAVAKPLVAHPEDADDHNLPVLVWYGLFPVADADPGRLVDVAAVCQWPKTLQFIARRIGESSGSDSAAIDALLTAASEMTAAQQADVIAGISAGLKGWRQAPKPKNWDIFVKKVDTSDKEALAGQIRELSVVFGDGRALAEIKAVAQDRRADYGLRLAALESLLVSKPDDLIDICRPLLKDRHLNLAAARGLVQVDNPEIGKLLVESYGSFHPLNRSELVSLLVTRESTANELLAAVAAGKIAKEDISAYHARQIFAIDSSDLTAKLGDVWGNLSETSAEKRKLIESLKSSLSDGKLAEANLSHGRLVFKQTCSKCHQLYGDGGKIGPDLTGSNRSNLDYLLENVVDPSAIVSKDFRMVNVQMEDGRVLSGYVTRKTDRVLELQTQENSLVLEQAEIAAEKQTDLSPMPDGLFKNLTADQIRDLIAYLKHPGQVELPPEQPSEQPAETESESE